MKIKKTIVSKIDMAEYENYLASKDSMTSEEQDEKFRELSNPKFRIDILGTIKETIKEDVKNVTDVICDEDNFHKLLCAGFVGTALFVCSDYHRTMKKIRKNYK